MTPRLSLSRSLPGLCLRYGIELSDVVDAINGVGATGGHGGDSRSASRGRFAARGNHCDGELAMQIDTKLSGIIQAARTTAENATLKPLDRNADLREAAEQFEAIFLNEFIKQARKANGCDILGSDAQDTYQDMMDRELSTQPGRVNLGIAEALYVSLVARVTADGKPL